MKGNSTGVKLTYLFINEKCVALKAAVFICTEHMHFIDPVNCLAYLHTRDSLFPLHKKVLNESQFPVIRHL